MSISSIALCEFSIICQGIFLIELFHFFTRLGLDHDGEGDSSDCSYASTRGSIMAPLIVARYDRFHWSRCSREVLKQNIE